jgi:MFS transporter, SET family, sugar efflux transporter
MLSTIAFVFRHQTLRINALLMFVASAAGAATMPYRSIMAIEALGMSEQTFSLMIFCSTVSSLIFGVSIGIISDFAGHRKRLMAIFSTMGVAGCALVWLFPSAWMMALVMIAILPFSNTNPLIYAGTRSATGGMKAGEAASVNSVLRTTMSAAWVVVPIAVAMVLEVNHLGVMNVWGLSGLLYVACLAMTIFLLPPQPRATSAEGGKSGFMKGLKELSDARVLVRVAAVSMLVSVNWLNAYLQPLIIKSTLGGTLGDAGFMASGVALLEIPAMLIWASVVRRTGAVATLACGGFLYALYFTGLGLVTSVWQVYALIPLIGLGAGAILSVPISYFQDLFPERPGLGTSLYPVQSFIGTAIAAGAFAGCSHFTGYQGTAITGAFLAIIAACLLVAVERFVPAPQTGPQPGAV